MSADKIKVGFVARPFGLPIGVLDFREKEAYACAGRQVESMRKKIGFNLLVRGEGFIRIAREHMDFMPSFAELMAEVISDPAGSADCVGEEDICQHQDFHHLGILSSGLELRLGVPSNAAIDHLAELILQGSGVTLRRCVLHFVHGPNLILANIIDPSKHSILWISVF